MQPRGRWPDRTILALANSLVAMRSATSVFAFFGVALSVFGVTATVATTAGATRSPTLLLYVFVLSTAVAFVVSLLFRFLRWNLVVWAIRRSLTPVIELRPFLLVGIGPGGAIVASVIAKLLVEAAGYEPFVFVIDREFKKEARTLDVKIPDIGTLNPDLAGGKDMKVLLVASEIHTGNTIKTVSEHLSAAKITHSTFAFLGSPLSCFTVNHCVLASDTRSILPWRDSPVRDDSST